MAFGVLWSQYQSFIISGFKTGSFGLTPRKRPFWLNLIAWLRGCQIMWRRQRRNPAGGRYLVAAQSPNPRKRGFISGAELGAENPC